MITLVAAVLSVALAQEENPFASCKEGQWARHRLTQSWLNVEIVSTLDQWIVKLAADRITLDGESTSGDQTMRSGETTRAFGKPARSEKVDVGGTSYDCGVWETRDGFGNIVKTWRVASGRFKGAVLRSEQPVDVQPGMIRFAAGSLTEDKVKVKGREFACIVVTGEETCAGTRSKKSWSCAEAPFGPLKEVTEWTDGGVKHTSTFELMDWGDDAASRPKPPKSK